MQDLKWMITVGVILIDDEVHEAQDLSMDMKTRKPATKTLVLFTLSSKLASNSMFN